MPYARAKTRAMVANKHLEDAYQEAYVGLWNAIKTYDPQMEIKFKTYAGSCIRNSVLNFIRREKRQIDNMIFYRDFEQRDKIPLPDKQLVLNEERQAITKACGVMTRREEYILFSRMLSSAPEGLVSIAEKWGTTKSSIERDEKRLKNRIEEDYNI